MSKYERTMNYSSNLNLKDVILDDENIIWEGKPKKSAFIINKGLIMFPFAMLWLAFDSIFILGFMQAEEKPMISIVFMIGFFALHLMPVWIWLGNVLTASKRWKNTRYVVTDKRILIQSGFIGIDFKTLYYKDINNVKLSVGIIDKLLNVGDIHFICNEASDSFLDIEGVYELYPKLQKIVLDIQTDMEYPNNLRPEKNDGYNTKYNSKI